MSIWTYNDAISDVEHVRMAVRSMKCIFCGTTLQSPRSEQDAELPADYSFVRQEEKFYIPMCCQVCGWWTLNKEDIRATSIGLEMVSYGAAGSLAELDLADQTLQIEDIRSYLAAKYDARFQIDPGKLEEVVASVYSDLGYYARVTGRSYDGGIDVVLDGPGSQMIGVQVKRYQGTISVEQIRSFAGALLLKNLTSGIFVTTSSFSRNASEAANLSAIRGTPIELVDALAFYDAIGLAQRAAYKSKTDHTAPWYSCEPSLLDTDTLS